MLPNPLPDTASALFVRRLMLQAKIGDLGTSDPLARKKSMLNEDPQAVQIDSTTLAAYALGKVYTMQINGVTVTYTAVSGDVDADGVAVSFAEQINANPDVRARVEAAATGSGGVMTLTGQIFGDTYTVTDVLNTTTVSTQTPANASEIPFGRLVLHKGFSSTPHRSANELCRLASNNAFSAQSTDVTVTAYDAATTYIVVIETDDGYVASFAVPADTDEAGSAADIEAAIDADLVLASKGITASVASAVVTIASATAGFGFKTTVGVDTGTGTIAITDEGYGIATSLLAAAAGLSMGTLDDEQTSRGSDIVTYRANDPVKVLTEGSLWVELDASDTAPTYGAPVYVDLTPGATAGRFYVAPASGRMKLPGATWLRGANNSVDLIGEVRVRLAG